VPQSRRLQGNDAVRIGSTKPAHWRAISGRIRAAVNRGDGPASVLVFQSGRQPCNRLSERAVNCILKEVTERTGVAAHADDKQGYARGNIGKPLTLGVGERWA
jgi:hypothetical protein